MGKIITTNDLNVKQPIHISEKDILTTSNMEKRTKENKRLANLEKARGAKKK